jgi:hypothetical protein
MEAGLQQSCAERRRLGIMSESTARAADLPAFARMALPRVPHLVRELAGIAVLAALFLAVAFWNGFPLVFYDTGAYLEEGLQGAFLVERSPVYSLLLAATGSWYSLWPVVTLQALMTAYLLSETARAEIPGLSLPGLIGIGVALTVLTGIAWYVGQVEPDCMTALVTLGSYLLLFHIARLGTGRLCLVAAVTGLAVACHPSHLGLIGGLLICGIGYRLLRHTRFGKLPKIRLLPIASALALALALILASNFALARSVFISRSGSVFVFARLMQDGIVKKLLDETCPQSGYRLCAYRDRLKTRADAWLWGPDSAFHAQGGFAGSQAEDQRIIVDSVKRYPFLQLKMAIYDSVLQFFMFKTGDGIESQEWILKPGIQRMMPGQLHAYLRARQQHNSIRFKDLNMLHVTVGMLSLLGLGLLLNHAVIRRRWDEATLPGLVLLALIGNAIICGTFSNPHDRYQSRLIWLPTLALLLARARDPHALQPVEESGT